VMYLGKICEVGSPDLLYAEPLHPYTEGLLSAIPDPDPEAELTDRTLAGELPSPVNPPSGCRFRTRCARASGLCERVEPELREHRSGHFVACHHPLDASPPA
jgi:peptide/nickel transport system ATP-binding protein